MKLRASGGPETREKGLKGNTITFPQNIVNIAESLLANPDILVVYLKVVFLGRTRQTREMLKICTFTNMLRPYHTSAKILNLSILTHLQKKVAK